MHLILINELTPGEKNKAWVDMLLKYLLSQWGAVVSPLFSFLNTEVWTQKFETHPVLIYI